MVEEEEEEQEGEDLSGPIRFCGGGPIRNE